MNPYIGQNSQLFGIEEHRLVGGKGDGMRLLLIRNGKGLEMTVSLDRCADISRLSVDAVNMGYFSPSGYVGPSYYQPTGSDWLKSFTAGFLTTCGLESVGSPCEDGGEILPLHGSIGNIPASESCWYQEGSELVIRALMRDEVLFGRKMQLDRQYRISLEENSFRILDTITNTGDKTEPLEILYHMNMGYPLLDEDSQLTIPASSVTGRDDFSAANIETRLQMEKPQAGYQERCYNYKFHDGKGLAVLYQPKLKKGIKIEFDAAKLDGFVQWKMMGFRDYVLGLECGNCYADGRDVMRRTGMLKFLNPGESVNYEVKISCISD